MGALPRGRDLREVRQADLAWPRLPNGKLRPFCFQKRIRDSSLETTIPKQETKYPKSGLRIPLRTAIANIPPPHMVSHGGFRHGLPSKLKCSLNSGFFTEAPQRRPVNDPEQLAQVPTPRCPSQQESELKTNVTHVYLSRASEPKGGEITSSRRPSCASCCSLSPRMSQVAHPHARLLATPHVNIEMAII